MDRTITLTAAGHVKTLADLNTICDDMALSLAQNASQTMTVDREGPFTMSNWHSLASPYMAEGFDEFRLIPNRWRAKAIAMIAKHVRDYGPSQEACALIDADRIAELAR